MANRHRGEVEIKLGGDTYTLKYGWTAVAKIETVTGLTIAEVADRLRSGNFHGATLVAVVWAMLQAHHSGITLDAAGDLMDEAESPSAVMDAVSEAMRRSGLHGGGEDKSENPRKASR